MAQEKEPKGITRRQFLKGATALGASALLSSCGLEASSSPSGKEATPSSPKFPPTGTPMAASTPFPESTRTETPSFLEPTPPGEMITFPQVQITPDLLKQGFVGIGGEEEINLGVMGVLNQGESREKVSWQTIEGYTSLAWNEKMALADLVQDEVRAAKALISLGAQAGVEGFYQPKEVLPQFKDLTLLRLTINQLPDNQDFYDAKVNASPQNLIIRKGTHLTLLGLWADESGRWATVAFDEGFDREKEGLQPREVPRQFLAVIPQNLPDETKGLSLESLLVANGYVYQVDMVEHQAESGQVYRQQLNSIEPTLARKLEKEAGALFMDQKEDGSWYENPLVPYPPEEQTSFHTVQSGETLSQIAQTYGLTLDELLKLNPDIKDPSKITVGQELTILIPGFTGYWGPTETEDNRVVILSADQTQELAQAKYDETTKAWEWEKVGQEAIITEPAQEPEQTVEKRPSFLDKVGWREEVRTEVMGVPVAIDIVTGKTLQERDWFAVEKIVLNKEYYPDAERRLGEIVMRAHWHAWVSDNPEERNNISFEEYMTRLKNGEDLSYEAVVSAEYLTGTVQPKEPVRIDPRKTVELVYTDKSQMIYLAEGVSYSLAMDDKGRLYISSTFLIPDKKMFEETHNEDDKIRILNYYTACPVVGLQILSLSNDFQKEGARVAKNWPEKDRLQWCGEFADIDNLVDTCNEDKLRNELKFASLVHALLKNSPF